MTIPACQGTARFDSLSQAEYVAADLPLIEGGNWKVVLCGDHYHVVEAPPGEPKGRQLGTGPGHEAYWKGAPA